jgi:hypothetical protein
MKFVPVEINLKQMAIHNADHSSGLSFGSALVVNRNVKAKKTQGAGQQFADAVIRFSSVSMALDDDLADSLGRKINK